ncbi:MAG: glycosyltransferase [Nanoarchaeota archaeon]
MSKTEIKSSIVIIFDKIREEKLTRLIASLKPQLNGSDASSSKESDTEIVLIHESNEPARLPELPLKVRYVNIPERRGIPFNRNQGIKHAQGEVIIFIDDDCWVHPNWFTSLIKPLLEDEKILVTTSGTKVPASNLVGDCIAALGFPGGGSLGFDKVWKVSEDSLTNHLAVGNCAMRKDIFEKVGFFDESMKSGAEDAEFSFRMEQAGIPVKYVPQAYAFHEARTTFSSFVNWQLRRGKANYQFKQKVGEVNSFIKLRLWSAKNILAENMFNWRLPLILSFLGASFVLQQVGYFGEKRKNEK